MKLLLDGGADINIANIDSSTARSIAKREGMFFSFEHFNLISKIIWRFHFKVI